MTCRLDWVVRRGSHRELKYELPNLKYELPKGASHVNQKEEMGGTDGVGWEGIPHFTQVGGTMMSVWR